MRVCVFVDGENFRHNIRRLFPTEFTDYLPKQARWADFFDWLVTSACGAQARRFRTYWYVLQHVDFYPYSFPDRRDSLLVTLRKDPATRERLDSLTPEERHQEAERIVRDLTRTKQEFANRFHGWQVIQDGIANRHRAIEFRRAGAISYNLFTRKIGNEKAVDVQLATDLITLNSIYDIALLLSGDQDYVPAVQAVKNAGKTVVNAAFKGAGGKLVPGGARRLNNATDECCQIDYQIFRDFLALSGPLPVPTEDTAIPHGASSIGEGSE